MPPARRNRENPETNDPWKMPSMQQQLHVYPTRAGLLRYCQAFLRMELVILTYGLMERSIQMIHKKMECTQVPYRDRDQDDTEIDRDTMR